MPSKKEMSEAGRIMGRKGGKARAKALSAERRKEIARKGGKAGGRGRPKKIA
jgi:general stress protein YciG